MGAPKAFLRLDGRELLERALVAAAPVASELVIGAGSDVEGCAAALLRYGGSEVAADPRADSPVFRWRGGTVRIVRDRRAGLGPLAGLEATLSRVERGAVWVLACDMPHVSPALGRLLLDRLAEAAPEAGLARAIVPRVEGRWQPLCAAYERTAGLAATRCLDRGERRVDRFLESLSVRPVEAEALRRVGDPLRLLRNVNRPEDLRRRAGRDPRSRVDPDVGSGPHPDRRG